MAETGANGVRGRVFDIQRFCVHDGPGIRTTVFLQGCPIRCVWCHNPEGVPARDLLCFRLERCVACGFCVDTCSRGAHVASGGVHTLERAKCTACGACTAECWPGALEIVGREVDVESVMAEVRRDAPFYQASGGGMTLSGGEPLSQPEFAAALARAARIEGIPTCVETCGFGERTAIDRLLPEVDLFLFDIKDTAEPSHRRYTGVSNRPILDNLRHLHDCGADLRLRVPLVPGFNDRQDHLDGVVTLCRALPRILGVEILPYHPLGKDKYGLLGLPPPPGLPDTSLDEGTLRAWASTLAGAGIPIVPL